MTIARCPSGELPSSTAAWVNRHTLLGSESFGRLWETVGGRPTCWLAGDRDRVVALLPGVEFGRGLFTRFQAMPDGLYATLLYPQGRPADEKTVAARLLDTIARHRYARLYLNDYFGRLDYSRRLTTRTGETMLVDIPASDWQPPDKKLRSEIRKAEREGVRVQAFSINRHLDRFLDLMKQTEERHGRKPKYPDAFYRELGKLSMIDLRVKWLVCEHEEQLAASHIFLAEGKMLFNWQVFFDKSYSFLKANQFITFSVAREMPVHGQTTLNLGASPADAPTLADYKLKWGGRSHEYNCLERKTWWSRWW